MSRNGKIAHLPRHIRDELNQRLDNGEPGVQLLEWLNALPEVKQVLENHFDSRPISKQNLHEWTRGGYQAWLRLQESREQVEALREQSSDLEKDTGGGSIADRLSTLLSVQLLAAIQQLETIKDPKERWLQTKDLLHELHRLRREDHDAARIRLAKEQWEEKWSQQQDQIEEACKKRKKKKLLKWLHSLHDRELNVQLLGGGKDGCRWARWFHCIENDLPIPSDMPLPDWWTFDDDQIYEDDILDADSGSHEPKGSSPTSQASQSKSNLACRAEVGRRRVKPSQSKSNVGQASCLSPSSPDTVAGPAKAGQTQPVLRSLGEGGSNPVKPNQSKRETTEPSSEHGNPVSLQPPSEGESCSQQRSAPATAADTNAPASSPPDPESRRSIAKADPHCSSGLPSPAEMLRAIEVRQKFK